MRQLTSGLGKIDYAQSAALFVLGAIRHDKPDLDFIPTIVQSNDFEAYLQIISSMHPPVKERFLLASGHWQSGEIKIADEVHLKCFLNDPMLLSEEAVLYYLSMLSKTFPEKSIELYVSNQKRQNGLGCSIFALTDVRTLYNVNLPGVDDGDLFEQLDRKKEKSTILNDHTRIHECRLPIKFLRSMQTNKVFNLIETEKHCIINKKGETVYGAIRRGFFMGSNGQKLENKRLELKLQKMAERVDRFIMSILGDDPQQNFQKLVQLAQEHTLPAFQDHVRIKNQEISSVYQGVLKNK
ncbi:MAG: hypothetical protein Q8R83_00615 [Legionellaceae bacterium]|nr:hypothetical protein [Legionellaceae bacterium]